MKKIALFLICLASWAAHAQNLSRTMTYAGEARSYRIYIPSTYQSGQPVPLVMALHGLGDNANNFQGVGFAQIADTANFIVVYPNALPDPILQSSGWNAGMHTFNNRDDAGFLNALLDTILNEYSIDTNKIYSCGFSLGGFMSYRLACEIGHRLAAVASVAGSLPAPSAADCLLDKPIPVLHFHGTGDQVIPYPFGMIYGVVTNLGADSTTHYWAVHNSCDATTTHDSLPDLKNDGLTFEKFAYTNCSDETEVILIKVNGMDHEWPSSSNDINATKEIWNFFSRHSKAAPPDTTGTPVIDPKEELVIRFSRTDGNTLAIANLSGTTKIIVSDSAGREVYRAETHDTSFQLPLTGLQSGLYLVTLLTNDSKLNYKVSVAR